MKYCQPMDTAIVNIILSILLLFASVDGLKKIQISKHLQFLIYVINLFNINFKDKIWKCYLFVDEVDSKN